MTKTKRTADGFRLFYSDEKFAAAFEDIRRILRERDGEVLRDVMNAPKRKRLIMKTEIAGTPVVVKQEFFIFRFDRTLKAFFFGSDTRNIFRVSERAWTRGFRKIPQAFLAAERFSAGILRETISLTEFLDGSALPQTLSDSQKEETENLIRECHSNGVISGDICPDNFLMTPHGLKLIDFRGHKLFPQLAMTRDRLQLECVFGIKIRNGEITEKFFFVLHALRNFGRKIRGKSTIPN